MGARNVLSVGQVYRFVLCLCIQCIDCAVVTLYNLIVRVHLLGVDVDGSTYRNSIQLSSSVALCRRSVGFDRLWAGWRMDMRTSVSRD